MSYAIINDDDAQKYTNEEIIKIEDKAYNQALEDLKFNLEEEKKTYAYNGYSLDTDKWLDSYLKSKLG